MPYVQLLPIEPSEVFVMPLIDVSTISRKWLDVDYTPNKPHPSRILDVFLPESGDGPFPTLICIHGGAFWGGNKRDMQIAAYMDAIPHGFAVVSVEQRLCNQLPNGGYNPEGVFPNPVFDFKAAIRYLRANARSFMLDPNSFTLCGGSAGGYHVLIAAASAANDVLYDKSLGFEDISGEVNAVVSWFSVGDLVLQSEYSSKNRVVVMPSGVETIIENFADIFLGVNARENKNLAHFASPSSWITKSMPPTLIQAGAADTIVPVECSREIVVKIKEICGADRVDYDEFQDYMHGDPRFSDENNMKRVFDWLAKVL